MFLCIFGSCQPRYYGPALASAILSCSGQGAVISPLLPVEIQQGKLSGRQISQIPDVSASQSETENVHNFVIDHRFTLALNCNAGSDGVVTVSLSSPPTFATHIPHISGFPDGLSDSHNDLESSLTSTGPTMTQLQGRPALPSEGPLDPPDAALSTHQTRQEGQPSAGLQDHAGDCSTTMKTSHSAQTTTSSTSKCGCSTTSSTTLHSSACESTAQAFTQKTSTSTTVQSTTVSPCETSSVIEMSVMTNTSSPTTTTTTTATAKSTVSKSEDTTCDTPLTAPTPTSHTFSTTSPCSNSVESSYEGNIHVPKLPTHSLSLFSNTTVTTSTLPDSTAAMSASSSCDTLSSSLVGVLTTTSSSSVSDLSITSSTHSSTSLTTSAISSPTSASTTLSFSSTTGETSACETSYISSKSSCSSSSAKTPIVTSLLSSSRPTPELAAYTTNELPQAYDTFTPVKLPSYAKAPPQYSEVATVKAGSQTPRSSFAATTSSSSALSTESSAISSITSSTTTNSVPSYGYHSEAASKTHASSSDESAASQGPSPSFIGEEYPSGTVSPLSSVPGNQVGITASSGSKSQIPGIETVPLPSPPSKSSSVWISRPPITTQMLPIGGPPILFVTIIEPDSDGNLETSVLTVSEQSPWQTAMPRAEGSQAFLQARVDGYRMGMASDGLTRQLKEQDITIPAFTPNNQTLTSVVAASNVTSREEAVETVMPTAILPVLVSSATRMVGSIYLTIAFCILLSFLSYQ